MRHTMFTAIETQCLLPSYLHALCRYAKRFGVDTLVGMTNDWDEQTLFDYREWGFARQPSEYAFARRKRAAIRQACAIVHGHGMKFYLWRHELTIHPAHIRKLNPAILDYTYGGGKKAGDWGEATVDIELGFFDPCKKALWDYVRWRYDHLFDLFPDLDGVVLTCLTETKLPLWNLSQAMSRAEVMQRLLDVSIKACRKRGKPIIVRNWGAYRDPHHPQGHVLPDALDAISAPPDVLLMEKSIEPDFALGYPPHSWLKSVCGRRGTLVELELAGETEGGSLVPACVPHEVAATIRHALDCGCRGFVLRVDSWADTIQWSRTLRTLGTQNEINLYAALRLINDPAAKVDQLWQEWAAERFGRALAPAIIDLLKPTFDAALAMFTCRRNIMSGPQPVRVLLNLTAYSRYFYTRLPEDARWRDALADPSDRDLKLLVQEKQSAADAYRQGLRKAKALRGRLPARWYAVLHAAFLHASELADFYVCYTEAFFRAARWRHSGDARERGKVKALIRRGTRRLATATLPNIPLSLHPARYRSDLQKALADIEELGQANQGHQ